MGKNKTPLGIMLPHEVICSHYCKSMELGIKTDFAFFDYPPRTISLRKLVYCCIIKLSFHQLRLFLGHLLIFL